MAVVARELSTSARSVFFVIGDIKGCFLGVGHTGGLLVVIDGCCLDVYLGGDFCIVSLSGLGNVSLIAVAAVSMPSTMTLMTVLGVYCVGGFSHRR